MLLSEKTLTEFGYTPDSLTFGSNKKVCVKCDYCSIVYTVINKNRNKSNKTLDKDACKNCRYKKRDEIGPNPFSREDVKTKIKNKYDGKSYVETEEFKQKSRKTMLDKYGVEHALQSKEIKEKHQNTIRGKYGVSNVSQIESAKTKRKETCKERFGSETFMSSKEGQKRLKEGVREKYKVENIFQSDEMKNKIKKTNLDKYGKEYPIQNEEILSKQKETVKQLYNVENVAQSEEVKEKINKTNIDKYGCSNPMKNSTIVDKMIKTKIDKGQIEIHKGRQKEEWAKEIGKPYSTFVLHVRKYGFEEAIQKPEYINGLENRLKNWLDKENIEYYFGVNIKGRKCDFLLPNNIVIELDGLFWHSDAILDNDYHILKRKHYIDNGYKPLFFRSDEVEHKLEIITSIINNKLRRTKKVGARKCHLCESSPTFFSDNHIMGKGQGKILGLEYDGQVVAAMQIKKTKSGSEISRFCTKLNHSVIGAFSKLLKYYGPIFPVNNFIDLRYGSGEYLRKFGFELSTCYPSFRWTDGNKSFHRLKFSGNSGYDHNLYKIWDCGQAKYVKDKDVLA